MSAPVWARLYTNGYLADDIARVGALKTKNDFLCLRAITDSALRGLRDDERDVKFVAGQLVRPNTADSLAETIAFEILEVGPDVKGDFKVGDHCEFIASAADALKAFGGEQSGVFFVREKWMPATWDPVAALAALDAEEQAIIEARAREAVAEAENAKELARLRADLKTAS